MQLQMPDGLGFMFVFDRMLRGDNAPVRADGKKTVSAWGTTIRGHAKIPEDPGKRACAMLTGDPLQVHVAAHSAVYESRVTNRRPPGIKSRIAVLTTPGTQPNDANQIIFHAISAGTAGTIALA